MSAGTDRLDQPSLNNEARFLGKMGVFKLLGNLETALDEPQPVEIDVPTLREAMVVLVSRFPRLSGELVDSSGEFNRYYVVLVNGELMGFLDDLDTRISASDHITILPPAAA